MTSVDLASMMYSKEFVYSLQSKFTEKPPYSFDEKDFQNCSLNKSKVKLPWFKTQKPKRSSSSFSKLKGSVKDQQERWIPNRITDDLEKSKKTTQDILNKLASSNFNTLSDRILDVPIYSLNYLREMTKIIYEKGVLEPAFGEIYARLCHKIKCNKEKRWQIIMDGKEYKFVNIMVQLCEADFKRPETTFEDEYNQRKDKMRRIGNIRLIGELYKKQMIPNSVIDHCIKTLINNKTNISVEVVCRLIHTVGMFFNEDTFLGEKLDSYLDNLDAVINDPSNGIITRVKFSVREIHELRENNWNSRSFQGKTQTIKDIKNKKKESEGMGMRLMPKMGLDKSSRESSPKQMSYSRITSSNSKSYRSFNNKSSYHSKSDGYQDRGSGDYSRGRGRGRSSGNGRGRGRGRGRGYGGRDDTGNSRHQIHNKPYQRKYEGYEKKYEKYEKFEKEYNKGTMAIRPCDDRERKESEWKTVNDTKKTYRVKSEKITKKKAESLIIKSIEEYIEIENLDEVKISFKEIKYNVFELKDIFILQFLNTYTDTLKKNQEKLIKLFGYFLDNKLFSKENITNALDIFLPNAEDIKLDIPRLEEYLHNLFKYLVEEENIYNWKDIKQILKKHCKDNNIFVGLCLGHSKEEMISHE